MLQKLAEDCANNVTDPKNKNKIKQKKNKESEKPSEPIANKPANKQDKINKNILRAGGRQPEGLGWDIYSGKSKRPGGRFQERILVG